ncbi:hypothetical protein N9903_00190 [bacterium]|nr:hypothetical protein [bacterium]
MRDEKEKERDLALAKLHLRRGKYLTRQSLPESRKGSSKTRQVCFDQNPENDEADSTK